MKLSDLPASEKPRERLIKYGASNLSNEDLLAIILRSGTKDNNVKILSSAILTKIKSIENLDELSINELTEIKGLGKVKAISLLAAIELGKRVASKTITDGVVINNTKITHEYFAQLIANNNQENLLVILLDNKKRLINYQIMYKGTIDTTLASPKEIYNYAIKEKASGLIIMHNHPSGIVTPSNEDRSLTNDLILSGKILGVTLLDHIITNGKDYFSFFNEMVADEV